MEFRQYPKAFALLWWIAIPFPAGFAQEESALRQEERADYYRRWIDEDAVYIVTEEEREVFLGLTTDEEREQFIEQFWFRRDPDPRTVENDFKDEHYRRLAVANERFTSGFPGWMTDRGRIYILHGPPAEIESYPSGGLYQRPAEEGGGQTSAFPFEIWRYRHIEGVGDDIVLEFVDPTGSGEYRLALRPEEKDALLHIPGAGATFAESMGLSTKRDRPFFNPTNRFDPLVTPTMRENPFRRYEILATVQRPPIVKYGDLKQFVEVNISYSDLPFQLQEAYFRLDEERVLIPVTLQVANRDLLFEPQGDRRIARVAVYGLVTSLQGRIAEEFEHDLLVGIPAGEAAENATRDSIYQKLLLLKSNQRYKLDVVVKDLRSGRVGVTRRALVPASPPGSSGLKASSILFADSIRVLDQAPEADEMFVLGDVKVLPNLKRIYRPETPLELYFHLYHAGIDQTSGAPALRIVYQFLREGQVVRVAVDSGPTAVHFAGGNLVVVLKRLSAEQLEPGSYQLRIEVEDLVAGQKTAVTESFVLTG